MNNSKFDKMLHTKDIKNLRELTITFCSNQQKVRFFTDLTTTLGLGKLHAIFSAAKHKGVSGLDLIKILISFPFLNQKNVNGFMGSHWMSYFEYGKDLFYRLKRNPKLNWRHFLFGVVQQGLSKTADYESSKGVRAFIFDDTIIAKTGMCIEGVSRVWNHVIHKSVLGYQLLVMGLYRGSSFMPIDFSLHREKGKDKNMLFGLKNKHFRNQSSKKRDTKSAGYKRKKELDSSKIAMAVTMVKRAIEKGIVAQYVLTDSWFTCWELVKTTMDNGLHYIGMFSIWKTKFTFRAKQMTYKEIRKYYRKQIKRNKRFNLYYIRTVVEWNDTKVVLYQIRKGKNGHWKVLLSTDLTSNFRQTLETYQIRWSIEVFFKESKQMLHLGKSQSIDFDVQIADTTIVMVQYIFLSIKNQLENYQTLGMLFRHTKQDSLKMKLHDRLIALLIAFSEILDDVLEDVDSQKLITKLIHNPKSFEKLKMLIYFAEQENSKKVA